jgi:hypothetical protein
MLVTDKILALRQDIFDLLSQQMKALDSPFGLSDSGLTECYRRQERVQELRERLQALSGSRFVVSETLQIGQGKGDGFCAARPPGATAVVTVRI